jgi:hypothetical protein
MSKKIIGGVKGFKQEPISLLSKKILSTKNGLYYNARSALYAVTQVSSIRRVWLPSFLCETILYPFQKAHLEYEYYAVNSFLEIDFEKIPIKTGDAVLVISYFGVPVDIEIYGILKSKGAIIIEDLSQSFYVKPKSIADFTIFSLRKFFAIPDGGVVISHGEQGLHEWPYVPEEDTSFAHYSLEAIAGRSLYNSEFDDSREWFSTFQLAESMMPTGLHPMSKFSQLQLASAIDFENDWDKRVLNFNFLFSKLEEIALINDMKGSAPVGFPIVLDSRDRIRAALFMHNIYPPIHWEIDGVVPSEFPESHQLSSRIMTLPCDGRYDLADMERMVSVLKRECGL